MISYRLAVAGTSLAIGLGLTGCNTKSEPPAPPPPAPKPPVKFDARDSPVTVEGGSIHAQAVKWTKGDKRNYTGTTTNYDQLYVDGVVWSGASGSVPSPITGWKQITIASDSKTDAATITPDGTCVPTGSCVLHFVAGQKSRWHVNKRNQLRYHDNDCDTDTEDGKCENSDCDFFWTITVLYSDGNGNPVTATGSCNDPSYGPGYCMIGIGKP
jgi:hypothetical protein